jgi:hypothetical protein
MAQALSEALRHKIIGHARDDLPLPAGGERAGVRGTNARTKRDIGKGEPARCGGGAFALNWRCGDIYAIGNSRASNS